MKNFGRDEKLHNFLDLAPCAWSSKVDSLTADELRELEQDLAAHAEQAAMATGYVVARYHSQDHGKSVKSANRFCTAIRRVIGFTYPKSDLSF